MTKIKNITVITVTFIICVALLVGCGSGVKYEYVDDLPRATYSLDIVDKTAIEYEITPDVAASIARAVFINIHGEQYVNERELTVFDNTELLEDIEKYGEFYEVGLNKPNYTDGEFIAISKIDGRILKVYWFG